VRLTRSSTVNPGWGCKKSEMSVDLGKLGLEAADYVEAFILRLASGLRLIWMRPLLRVVFVPSTPMKERKTLDAGS